jgi:hypothetical protein
MMLGFAAVMNPIRVLADVVPVLGGIAGAGLALLALMLTCILAPLVIAVGWLFYRPEVAIAVLVGGALLTICAYRLARHGNTRKAPVPA